MSFVMEMLAWIADFVKNGIKYEVKPDGSLGSILRYSIDYAISIGWLFPRRGSIFSLAGQIAVMGSLTLFCTLLAAGGCEVSNTPGCIHFPAPSTTYLTLMTLCSFVVAFFANAVLTRWWSMRQALQGGFGGGYNMMMNLCGMMIASSNSQDQESKFRLQQRADHLTAKIIGYLILSHRLVFAQSRTDKDVSDLVDHGILSSDDYSYFSSLSGNPVDPLCFVSSLLQHAANIGLLGCDNIAASNLASLLQDLSNVRSNLSAIGLYVGTQLPFPFVQMIMSICYAFLIQLIYVCSAYISAGMADASGAGQANLATGYLTINLYGFVLIGLMNLFSILSDPMGDDAADFPGDSYMQTFEKNLKGIRANMMSSLYDCPGMWGPLLGDDNDFKDKGSRAQSGRATSKGESTLSEIYEPLDLDERDSFVGVNVNEGNSSAAKSQVSIFNQTAVGVSANGVVMGSNPAATKQKSAIADDASISIDVDAF